MVAHNEDIILETDEKFSITEVSKKEYKKVVNIIIEIIAAFLTIIFVIATITGPLLRILSLEDLENNTSFQKKALLVQI